MSNLAISNPFKYVEQYLNVNLLKGISTSLIESGILYQIFGYCSQNHCIYKCYEVNKDSKAFKFILEDINESNGHNFLFKILDVEANPILLNEKVKIDSGLQNLDKYMKTRRISGHLTSTQFNNSIYGFKSLYEADKFDWNPDVSNLTESIENSLETPSTTNRRIQNTEQKSKLVRWGKKNDRVLWTALKELEAESKETYDMIISTDSIDIKQHRRLIRSLCSKSKWKGSFKKFLRRVKKLTIKDRFSFRETSGKDKSIILDEIKRIKSHYRIMKNIQIIDSENNLSLIIK